MLPVLASVELLPALALCYARTSSKVGNRSPSTCIDATNELPTDAPIAGVFVLDLIHMERACGKKAVRIMIVTHLKPKPGTSNKSASHR